ncbi:MAG: DUF2868 domain-containing protein [Betaproteobacteria bacterium]
MKVIAVRAMESADGARALWSDADRAWASRAAAEVVGADATPDAFLARRATLAIERFGTRHPALPRAVRSLRWRPWCGWVVIGLAFVAGAFLDQVDGAKRINILAPPVLGLLAWNLAVYAVLIVGYVVRYGESATPGPLRAAVARIAGGATRLRGSGGLRETILAFAEDWARRAGPLYGARAARILHLAAAALAAGVVGGLYLRGLALEYRASWESTFLDPTRVRAIVAFAYAPGAYVTGIPVPTVDSIAAVRAPGAENAARWLHLMAATVGLIVIIPRLLLAGLAGAIERHRAARVPITLDDPYFRRLLRGYRGGPAHVRVMPYSYALPAAALAGLEALVARAFGGSAAMLVAAPVAYGTDDAFAGAGAAAAGTTLVAVFSATATPEREVHGSYLEDLARRSVGAEALFAVIDESGWIARQGGEPARLDARRTAWRQVCDAAGVPSVSVDLANPNLAAVDAALDAAIGDRAQ